MKLCANYQADSCSVEWDKMAEFMEKVPAPFKERVRGHRITVEGLRRSSWVKKIMPLPYAQAQSLPIPRSFRESILIEVFPQDHTRD